MVVDYRKLNQQTVKDALPLSRIDETLEKLGKAKVYSTIDLKKGFWQVPVAEEDKSKTAFSTKFGTYEFNTMPFGLTNAPAKFQRMMNNLLEDYVGKFVEVYIDDIIIYSENFTDHLEHLERVFRILNRVNLKLSLEKSKFFQTEVKFLEHKISAEGIQVDERKIKTVKDFPIPRNVREIRGFLGLASYYRKFIKGFSQIAKPLNTLLKKDVKFQWTKACQVSFETLKDKLITAPILRYPDFKKPFYITTDASGTGLGAILSQRDEVAKKEYVIEYASRSLNNAESRYSAQELECLAVLWAIEHFHPYVGYNKFHVITDNAALKWLHTSGLKQKRGRWIHKMQEYDFDIIHKARKKNTNADALSRIPY